MNTAGRHYLPEERGSENMQVPTNIEGEGRVLLYRESLNLKRSPTSTSVTVKIIHNLQSFA